MKKSIAILFVLLILVPFGVTARAEENAIQLLADSSQYNVDDPIKVIVKTIGAKDVYSADLTLNYDTEYLELIKSNFNEFNDLGNSKENGNHRYLLSILGKDKGIDGDVQIAEFQFKALKSGATKINLPSVILVNSKEEKIENIQTKPLEISIKEKVNRVGVKDISINISSHRLKVGEGYKLIENVLPDNASNKKVFWKSSDESIVEVRDGYIRGLKVGNALITVTTDEGNKTAQCTVEVYEETNTVPEDNNPITGNNDSTSKELPQTGGRSYLAVIGLVMVVLGVIIKKYN